MNKFINLIKNVARHDLVSGSFFIFVGSTISSFMAFLLNIYFARELSYADYGIFASLLSIVSLLTIPSAALSAIIVRYATLFFSRKEDKKAGAFYKQAFKYLLLFSISLNIGLLLIFPLISSFLKIDQIGLIFLTGVSVTTFYMAILNLGFLQSMLKFRLIGLLHLLAGIGKLASGAILVFIGWKVYGALFATFAFSLIGFLLSFIPLRKVIRNAGKEINIGVKDVTAYAVPTTVAIFALSSFISSDVLLVKHFFSATEAGYYGGLSLVGKVIFYFTGPIPIVMFPLIVKKHAVSENFRNLFFVAIVMVLIPAFLISGFYFLFPDFTIKLFLGGKGYLAIAPYLGLFGIFLTVYSVNNVFVNFFISVKKTKMCLVALFWAIIQIILICIFHDNFYQIIYVSIATSILLLISLLLYYLKVYGVNYPKK